VNNPANIDVKNWDADGGPMIMDLKLTPGSPKTTRAYIIGTKEGMAYCVIYDTWAIHWSTRMLPPAPTGSSYSGVNTAGASNGVDRVYFAVIYSYTGNALSSPFSDLATAVFSLNALTGDIECQTTQTYTGGGFNAVTASDGLLWVTWYNSDLVFGDGLPQKATLRVFDSKTCGLLRQMQPPYPATTLTVSYSAVTIYQNTVIWASRENATSSHLYFMGV
jgi:hypothetical protein